MGSHRKVFSGGQISVFKRHFWLQCRDSRESLNVLKGLRLLLIYLLSLPSPPAIANFFPCQPLLLSLPICCLLVSGKLFPSPEPATSYCSSWLLPSNCHFIMLIDTVGQEFRQGKRRRLVSAPCWLSLNSEDTATAGSDLNDRELEPPGGYFTNVSGPWAGACIPGAPTHGLSMRLGLLHHMMVLELLDFLHGSSGYLALETYGIILLYPIGYKARPDSRGGHLWKKCQRTCSHVLKPQQTYWNLAA